MKKQLIKMVGGAMAILTMAIFTQVCVSAQSKGDRSEQRTIIGETAKDQGLVGSWDLTITIRDCDLGTAFGSFPAMMTFNQGGTMQEAANDAAPLFRNAGHGIWSHQSGRTYRRVFHFFRYNPDGTFAGTARITALLDLNTDGNSFAGTSYFDFLDQNGASVGTGCATEAGIRFQ